MITDGDHLCLANRNCDAQQIVLSMFNWFKDYEGVPEKYP